MSNKEPNLKIKYKKVAEELNKEFGYKTVMQIPRIEKVIVSVGCGDAIENKKLLDAAVGELALITGQNSTDAETTLWVSRNRLSSPRLTLTRLSG